MAQENFVDRLERGVDRWVHIFGLICCYSFLVVMVIMVYEVVARYAFAKPTIWSIEISTYFAAGVSFLGAGYVLRKDHHVRVDIFYRKFSLRTKAWANTITQFLFLCCLIYFVHNSVRMVYTSYIFQWHSGTALNALLWIPYLVVPIGFITLFLAVVSEIYDNIKVLRGGK